MKRTLIALALLGAFGAAQATDYNAEGKNFGKGQLDKLKGSVSDANAKTSPHYTTNPPQKSSYGATSLFDVGSQRINSCKTAGSSGDRIADQECEAVNFLAKNPRAHFELSPSDPAIIAGKVIADGAADLADQITGGAGCVEKTTTTPAEKTIETCAEYLPVEDKQCSIGWNVDVNADSNFQCDQTYKATEILTCERTLKATCDTVGAIVTGIGTTKDAIFDDVSVTQSAQTGLYDFRFNVPRVCGTEGDAKITFNLDTVGAGGYVTINVSQLDDAAIVAVNTQPVFAGHPNSGPKYSGTFFPTGNGAYQRNYSWQERYGDKCVEWTSQGDSGDLCTKFEPNYRTYTASAKLLDYCPSGYAKQSQKDITDQWCNLESGYCPDTSAYSPDNVQGFFCNPEGKFLMNRAEGSGTWGGQVDATLPIKAGANTISVYWGTSRSGGACGNVLVTGQIYNVKQQCSTSWTDNCGDLEARTK